MRKVVINRGSGCFRLSNKAKDLLEALGHPRLNRKNSYHGCIELFIPRDDVLLVQVVEELGSEADGPNANLVVVAIPDDILWEINQDNGHEWVAEVHRRWY